MRFPRITLAIAIAVLVVLGIYGLGVSDRLKPTSLEIPGTDSAEANQLLREYFGESAPFAILLRGPEAELDRQGPELIRALREDPDVTTLSPWDRGQVERLRPSPRQALIVADFHVEIEEAVNETVPDLDRTLEATIEPPVVATQTGFATLSRAIQAESIDATNRGQLIALPFLLIVLLLVFRSPIAAAVPLLLGGLVVFSSRGILYHLAGWINIDGFALVVCTMIGLALGVDYGLLMVSRFREELRGGADVQSAAWATRRTAGRTVIFAGGTLVLAMAVAVLVLPGSLLVSLAGTVAMVTTLSAVVAMVLGPALLVLLGPRVDLWRVGRNHENGRATMAWVSGALRNPAAAAALILALLIALSAPALGLETGPPSPEQLPADDEVRQDTELIEQVAGPGWDAPFTLVAASRYGPITEPWRFDRLVDWQERIAEEDHVQAVIGPAEIDEETRQLRYLGPVLLATEGGPLEQLEELGRELGRAAGGVAELREGLAEAAHGASLLGSGANQAGSGAMALARGLEQAESGSAAAVDALGAFAEGARQLADAQEEALIGTLGLRLGLRDLIPNLRNNATVRAEALEESLEDQLERMPTLEEAAEDADESSRDALEALEGMTVGQADPRYDDALGAARDAVAAITGTDSQTGEPYAEDYDGMVDELSALTEQLRADAEDAFQIRAWLETGEGVLRQLRDGADRLHEGMVDIMQGARRLADGAEELAEAAEGLGAGIDQLVGGAVTLAEGVGILEGGAFELAAGLSEGHDQAGPLQFGLDEAGVQVTEGAGTARRQIEDFRETSPGLFNSGYFVLAALDGAPEPESEAAGEIIDLDRAGQAASIFVIPTAGFNTPESLALDDRLGELADHIAADTGTETGVAGGAAELNDYGQITTQRFPIVVAAVTIATFLVLIVVLRALLLSVIAVILNLLSVGVAFGVLTLLFNVPPDWPLGGRSYVDAVGATAIFGIIFGLSIDYAVFLLARMREHYDLHGNFEESIRFGLQRTARVITGAAAIMMAVFIAFAGAPIATVSQLGVGLTVAVLLDATVVRIILLPALMMMIGPKVWWLPASIERRLPRLEARS